MKIRASTKLRDSSFSPRCSPVWYGWKVRLVWLMGVIVGPISKRAKVACQDWATTQAYRLGASDYGAHFNTPRFSRNEKIADAYDSGAYDVWVKDLHDDNRLSYLY